MGGVRSLHDEILATIKGYLGRRGSFELHGWEQAHAFGIEVNASIDAWSAGHVTAILPMGWSAIVGSENGGVWILNPRYDAIPQTKNFEAVSLSYDWDNPNVTALSSGFGADRNRIVYAGCAGDGSLYVIEVKTVPGAVEYVGARSIPLPVLGGVTAILVMTTDRRIVLGTGSGVWSSPIPADPLDPGGYSWTQTNMTRSVHGLAAGPDDTVIAAADGGLYRSAAGLQFSVATVTGIDATTMGNTSVASCATRLSTAYAMTTVDGETVAAILRTSDGGENWAPVRKPSDGLTPPASAGGHALPGHVLWYANCLAVSPVDDRLLAVGWSSGPFFSADGGMTWALPNDNTDTPHLHADLHALAFTGDPGNPNALFVGSDGGVAYTTDLGKTYDSRYNKHLTNIECYDGDLSVSDQIAGLFGAGTQDNGDLYGLADEAVWRTLYQLNGGDGGLVCFCGNGLLLRTWNTQPSVKSIPFTAAGSADGTYDTVVPVDGNPAGLAATVLAPVRSPSYSRADGTRLYACAAAGPNLHGFFARPDGTLPQVHTIATLTGNISSLASFDGQAVLAGTGGGQIVAIDTATGATTTNTITGDPAPGNPVSHLVWVSADERYAAVADNIMRWDGSAWRQASALPTPGLKGLDAAAGTGLFAATASTVYGIDDGGRSWTAITAGLPRVPSIADLRVAREPQGRVWVYVSTWGWGVFRLLVDYPQTGQRLPEFDGAEFRILWGIINDAGGLVLKPGGGSGRVPPREPVTDLFTGVLIAALGTRITHPSGVRLRIAAFDTIASIANHESEQLQRGERG